MLLCDEDFYVLVYEICYYEIILLYSLELCCVIILLRNLCYGLLVLDYVIRLGVVFMCLKECY